jgi:hypothetical protein
MCEIESDPPADPACRPGDEDGAGQVAASQSLLVIWSAPYQLCKPNQGCSPSVENSVWRRFGQMSKPRIGTLTNAIRILR